MFEFHMLVVTVVMLNILELIMEIVPNYPTWAWFIGRERGLWMTRVASSYVAPSFPFAKVGLYVGVPAVNSCREDRERNLFSMSMGLMGWTAGTYCGVPSGS
jgi:hypothetical protein